MRKSVLSDSAPRLLKTSLGRSMAVFLLSISLLVVAINAWSLWHSWQQHLTEKEEDARNLSLSLAKQAEDAFLQVDITLADAVRQLLQRRSSCIKSRTSRANCRSFMDCLFTTPMDIGLLHLATSRRPMPVTPIAIILSGIGRIPVWISISAMSSAVVQRVTW